MKSNSSCTAPSTMALLSPAKSLGNLSLAPILLLLITVVIAAFGIRAYQLDADPPSWYIPADQGFHVDEGYKTFAAKNLHLFGTSHWNLEDTYRAWLTMSPLTQYSFYVAFNAWGLELASARMVNVGFFTLFVLIFSIFALRYWGPAAALLGAVMLSLDPALFHFSRVALFESALILFMFSGMLCLNMLPRDRFFSAASILGVVAFLAAFLIKMSALLYLAPACGVLVVAGFLERHQLTKRQYAILGALLALFAITLFLYRGVWLWRVALIDILQAPQLLFWSHLAVLSPLLGVCAYCCIIHTIADRPALLVENPFRLALVATVVGVPLLLALISYNPPRYYVPIAPAAILLIVDWMQRRHSAMAKPLSQLQPAQIAAIVLLLMIIVMHLLRLADLLIVRPLDQSEEPGISKVALIWLFLGPAGLVALLAYLCRDKIDDRVMKHATLAALAGYLVCSIAITGRGIVMPSHASQVVRAALDDQVAPGESVAGGWAPYFTAESVIPSLYLNIKQNHPDDVELTRPDFFIHSDIPNDIISLAILKDNARITLDPPTDLGAYHSKNIKLYRIHYPDEPGAATH